MERVLSSNRISRALRRHHVARLKVKRQRFWGRLPLHATSDTIYRAAWTPKSLGAVVQYPAYCSCPMCGNPRNHFGHRSMQELIWLQESVEDQLA